MPPEEIEHGEHTGRIVTLTKEAVHDELSIVKRIQTWVTIGLTVAGLGFGAAMFFNRYANAADVEKIADKADEISKQLSTHIIAESSRQGALEAQTHNIEQDYHWQREQLQRVADRVGAARVPVPEHEPAPPAKVKP